MGDNKTMIAFTSNTLRGLVKAVNENNIQKESIVTILKENGQFVLVYYI